MVGRITETVSSVQSNLTSLLSGPLCPYQPVPCCANLLSIVIGSIQVVFSFTIYFYNVLNVDGFRGTTVTISACQPVPKCWLVLWTVGGTSRFRTSVPHRELCSCKIFVSKRALKRIFFQGGGCHPHTPVLQMEPRAVQLFTKRLRR